MQALLDKGADPNARLQQKVWYSQYNFDRRASTRPGATPFWRAAYAGDVDAMKLLVAYGADPNIADDADAGRPRTRRRPEPRVVQDVSGCRRFRSAAPASRRCWRPPARATAKGFAANPHRFAPSGMLAAVKYLVEELHVDVNARDHEGNTALHNAAARGDNEMILYLVSKGADAESRQPRRPDDRRHGERPGAAHPAVPRHDQAARRPGREEQPQVRLMLM